MLEFDGFDWDDGNWPKCGKHGVGQDEIEALFFAPSLKVLQVLRPGSVEPRWLGFGMIIGSGRWLSVVFTIREPDRKVRPISARYMHRKDVLRHVTG